MPNPCGTGKANEVRSLSALAKGLAICCLVAGLLCGCTEARRQTESAQRKDESQTSASDAGSTGDNGEPTEKDEIKVRNNAASLLADLLGQEKNVSKILIIKKTSPAFGRLIKGVAKTSDDGAKDLDKLAKDDPSLDLHELQLPPGEAATRKAQSKSEEHTLLSTSNGTFEFNLPLSQAEALDYGSHLAGVAAETSTASGEARKF